MDFPICSECRKPCNEVRRNFGYGRTEYWGAISCHDNWQSVSKCCDGDLIYELEEEDELDDGDGLSASSASGECSQISVLDVGNNSPDLLV